MSLKEKLLSRKLWVAVLTAAGGIAIAFGAPDNIVNLIVGASIALASAIVYIVTEGKIDAAAVALTSDLAQQTIALIDALKKPAPSPAETDADESIGETD